MGLLGKLSLSGQIAVGIAAGLLFGLFAGEPAGHLQIVGDAFVQLLQMAVPPLSLLISMDAALTQPYLEMTLAFIVDDHTRNRFATWEDMSAIPNLRIAVVEDHYFEPKLERAFPEAEVVELSSVREFFEDRSSDADALLYTAEAGATWTLLYPDFSVVVPRPESPVMPIAFAVEREDDELRVFLDRWIELSTGTGVIRRAYDHWVLGVGAVEEKPRWSIVRDVLHWID